MLLLLLVYAVGTLWVLFELVSNQVQQVIEISFIKTEQIKSKTIAELKQNEFHIISQDLWGSA